MLPSVRASGVLAHNLLHSAGFAKAAEKATGAVAVQKDWRAVTIPKETLADIPTTTGSGSAFAGDIRATSGLGLGDGCKHHTEKWLQGDVKSPLEWMAEVVPIKVKGLVVASHGSDDPALGCPVEYINLKGTTLEEPAVCKYTGNKYYSDDWKYGGHH